MGLMHKKRLFAAMWKSRSKRTDRRLKAYEWIGGNSGGTNTSTKLWIHFRFFGYDLSANFHGVSFLRILISAPPNKAHLNRSVIFCSCLPIRLLPQAIHNNFLLHDTCTPNTHTNVYMENVCIVFGFSYWIFFFFVHVIPNFKSSFQLSGCTNNNRPNIVLIFNLNMKWNQVDKLVIRMAHTNKAECDGYIRRAKKKEQTGQVSEQEWRMKERTRERERACQTRWSIDFASFEYRAHSTFANTHTHACHQQIDTKTFYTTNHLAIIVRWRLHNKHQR